jgi:hypothetical protein
MTIETLGIDIAKNVFRPQVEVNQHIVQHRISLSHGESAEMVGKISVQVIRCVGKSRIVFSAKRMSRPSVYNLLKQLKRSSCRRIRADQAENLAFLLFEGYAVGHDNAA